MLRKNSDGLHQLHILMTRNLSFNSSSIVLIFWPIVCRHFLAQPHSGHTFPKREECENIRTETPRRGAECHTVIHLNLDIWAQSRDCINEIFKSSRLGLNYEKILFHWANIVTELHICLLGLLHNIHAYKCFCL